MKSTVPLHDHSIVASVSKYRLEYTLLFRCETNVGKLMTSDIDARQIFQAVYDRRLFILGVTLLAAFLAGIRSLVFSTPSYEAEVILAETKPALARNGLSELVPDPLHMKAYANLIESTTIVGELHARLAETGFWNEAGQTPTLNAFESKLRLTIVTVDQTTRPVNYSPFLTLLAKGATPGEAQQIASLWAEIAIEAAQRSNHIRVASTVDALRDQETKYEDVLKAALEELAKEESEWNLILLEAQAMLQVEAVEKLRTDLTTQRLAMAARGASLDALKKELDGVEPKVQLFRAPSNDVFWLKDGKPSGAAGSDQAVQGMLDEVVNEVYVSLRTREKLLVEELAHFQAAVESLELDIQRRDEDRASAQRNLAEHKNLQRELEQAVEIAEESFGEVARLRSLAEAAAGLSGDQAERNTTPIGLNRVSDNVYVREDPPLISGTLTVILAAISAFTLACAYVIAVRFSSLIQSGDESTDAE